MDRKGKRGSKSRSSRPKKRRFCGNQHSSETDTAYASTSAKKLKDSEDVELRINEEHSYSILNFFSVFSAISALVVCIKCKEEVTFTKASPRGLGFKIAVECSCGVTYVNSCPLIDKAYEINRRIVFAMRLLGVGIKGLGLFCGIMDIGQGLASKMYYACLENVHCASKAVYDIVTRKAVEEEKEENAKHDNPPSELTVFGNGTWKKRGFSSLFGVTTLIGVYSNKVIDTVVKSSLCESCSHWKNRSGTVEYETWKNSHDNECTINHEGSAGKMEAEAVKEMFLRSMDEHHARYKRYVGNGDSETSKYLAEAVLYGEDFVVERKECVGHVEKRLGTRLRNARQKNKGIGGIGAGKLTDEVINELTTHCGLAIRRNSGSVADMKSAIWATFDHERSTNDDPHHEGCPEGPESWCEWRKAEAAGTLGSFRHSKPALNDAVLQVIRPIYEDFTSDDLLERCLGAFAESNNDSLNSVIWSFAPKHLDCRKKSVDIANFLATVIFNEGFNEILHIMNVMGVKIGQNAKNYADVNDNSRIEQYNRRAAVASTKGKTASREERAALYDFFEAEEGLLYGPGIAD